MTQNRVRVKCPAANQNRELSERSYFSLSRTQRIYFRIPFIPRACLDKQVLPFNLLSCSFLISFPPLSICTFLRKRASSPPSTSLFLTPGERHVPLFRVSATFGDVPQPGQLPDSTCRPWDREFLHAPADPHVEPRGAHRHRPAGLGTTATAAPAAHLTAPGGASVPLPRQPLRPPHTSLLRWDRNTGQLRSLPWVDIR